MNSNGITRREHLSMLLGAGALLLAPSGLTAAVSDPRVQVARTYDGEELFFEVHGDKGPFVFLGPQIYRTVPAVFPPETAQTYQGYVDALKDRYRVIVADWPRGMGEKPTPASPESLTAENGIRDVLAIADAAGAREFAWWGYSFGGAFGLQLAMTSDRVSALVCAGFPPLWQPLSDMLMTVRRMAAGPTSLPEGMDVSISKAEAKNAPMQSVRFYESVVAQNQDEAIKNIACPRLVLHDNDDVVELGGMIHDLSARTRAAEQELIKLGWNTAWIDTGLQHFAMRDVGRMVGAFAPFLDEALL